MRVHEHDPGAAVSERASVLEGDAPTAEMAGSVMAVGAVSTPTSESDHALGVRTLHIVTKLEDRHILEKM